MLSVLDKMPLSDCPVPNVQSIACQSDTILVFQFSEAVSQDIANALISSLETLNLPIKCIIIPHNINIFELAKDLDVDELQAIMRSVESN